jgi:hypothetical protein
MKRKSIMRLFSLKKQPEKRILVNVCAWCPKGNYPALKVGQEYTHGMCRKHYKKLSIKKNLPISFLIAEFLETTFKSLDIKKRNSSFILLSLSKKYLMQLKTILKTSILSA